MKGNGGQLPICGAGKVLCAEMNFDGNPVYQALASC